MSSQFVSGRRNTSKSGVPATFAWSRSRSSPIASRRDWKRAHRRDERFPGGESLDDAARRYATAFRRLADRPERALLVVCHEIPVRYALNAAAGSDDLDAPAHTIPNATPYLFDEAALARAAVRITALAGDPF